VYHQSAITIAHARLFTSNNNAAYHQLQGHQSASHHHACSPAWLATNNYYRHRRQWSIITFVIASAANAFRHQVHHQSPPGAVNTWEWVKMYQQYHPSLPTKGHTGQHHNAWAIRWLFIISFAVQPQQAGSTTPHHHQGRSHQFHQLPITSRSPSGANSSITTIN